MSFEDLRTGLFMKNPSNKQISENCYGKRTLKTLTELRHLMWVLISITHFFFIAYEFPLISVVALDFWGLYFLMLITFNFTLYTPSS